MGHCLKPHSLSLNPNTPDHKFLMYIDFQMHSKSALPIPWTRYPSLSIIFTAIDSFCPCTSVLHFSISWSNRVWFFVGFFVLAVNSTFLFPTNQSTNFSVCNSNSFVQIIRLFIRRSLAMKSRILTQLVPEPVYLSYLLLIPVRTARTTGGWVFDLHYKAASNSGRFGLVSAWIR